MIGIGWVGLAYLLCAAIAWFRIEKIWHISEEVQGWQRHAVQIALSLSWPALIVLRMFTTRK